jgi:hypothetical protein
VNILPSITNKEFYQHHPSYKDIDPEELLKMRGEGKTVKEICEIKGICKRTFYNKINDYEESA